MSQEHILNRCRLHVGFVQCKRTLMLIDLKNIANVLFKIRLQRAKVTSLPNEVLENQLAVDFEIKRKISLSLSRSINQNNVTEVYMCNCRHRTCSPSQGTRSHRAKKYQQLPSQQRETQQAHRYMVDRPYPWQPNIELID